MTKEIPLTKGLIAIVDDSDYERVSEHMWHAHFNGKSYYASTNKYIGHQECRQVLLHRFVIGAKSGETVDHINRNTLDCRKENLRICTNSQNRANSAKEVPKTSRHKGVSRKILNGNIIWQSKIQINNKLIFLGVYNDEDSAAYAYNCAALEIFKEYAVLNELPDGFIPSPKRQRNIHSRSRDSLGRLL